MPAADENDVFIESDTESRSRLKAKVAIAIALIGWLLIGFNINSILFNSFPLKLTQPEWQLDFIAQLLSTCTSFLFAATLITLSQVFNPKEQILKDWNRTLTRLASLFAVVLVLSIPLQFYLGSRVLSNRTISAFESINKIKSIVKQVSSINSEADFRLYVGSLPNPQQLPAKFNVPFSVVKQRALENLQGQVNTATENMQTQKSQALQTFLKEAVRNTAQCILMAAAFSVLAGLNPKSANIVTRLFDKLL
jgi:hypothetical protein